MHIGTCGVMPAYSSRVISLRLGIKGEIDMVGYDGSMLAFVEVKTRTILETSVGSSLPIKPTPEDAVNWEERRNLSRMARLSSRPPYRNR